MEGGEEKEDPSLVFAKSVMGQIQKEDILSMVIAQREMLMRYEKTNEMLLNFNMLSGTRYETTMLEFRKHTTLLYEMKKDLDTIFRRIRLLKGRLCSQHPAAFSACSDVYNVLEEKNGDKAEDDEVEKSTEEGDKEDKTSAASEPKVQESVDVSIPTIVESKQQVQDQVPENPKTAKEQQEVVPESQQPVEEKDPQTQRNT